MGPGGRKKTRSIGKRATGGLTDKQRRGGRWQGLQSQINRLTHLITITDSREEQLKLAGQIRKLIAEQRGLMAEQIEL